MLGRIKSLGLGARIIAIVLTIILVVVTVNYVVFVTGYKQSAEDAMVQKAAAFTAVADESKNHAARLSKADAFDTELLLGELEQAINNGKSYKETRIFNTLPVVVGWTTAEEAAKREHIEFHVRAFEARNSKNEPAAGTFEHELLTDLTRQVKANGPEVVHRINEETNALHYMRAIRLTHDCMMCHGKRGNEFDADGDGIDIVGFDMEGWEVGYMHGAYEVILPLAPMDAAVTAFIGNGLMWTVPLVAVAIIGFAFLIRNMISKPIKAIIEKLRLIAGGDLTQKVDDRRGDELGQMGSAFNESISNLHDVIVEVSRSSRDVAGAATQIAASAEEMNVGMKSQNDQTTRVSAAVEEMSASVIEVARKSADAADNANRSGRTAEEGGEVVAQTVEGMKAINTAVSGVSSTVQDLGKRGEQIGQIIEVINDIADQTNLLALNAAIEAARAGEHGRGFAVVADEVRKLADRTTNATDEIAESIKMIQKETAGAVGKMSESTTQVEQGVELATRAGTSLSQIVGSARDVAAMIQSIAAAAEQQSAASQEVSQNVESINAIAKQSFEATAQAADAANHLSSKAEQLKKLINQFTVNEHTHKERDQAV